MVLISIPSWTISQSGLQNQISKSADHTIQSSGSRIPQFSQSLDGVDGLFDHIIYFLLSRKPANPKANTRVGDVIGRTQRAEDVARLQAGRGTRRARGQCGVLHCHEERFALDVRKREVDTARVAAFRCRGTVAVDVGAAGGNALDEALGEGRYACVVVLVRVSQSCFCNKTSRGEVGRTLQYPCTQAHRRVECDS
jgi:hypothetical protein